MHLLNQNGGTLLRNHAIKLLSPRAIHEFLPLNS
jgi:hypothetical protein